MNVSNLIKDDGYVTVSKVAVAGVLRNVHSYPAPRSFLLTTTVDF